MEAASAKPGRTQSCSGKTGATPPFGDCRRPVSRSRRRNSPMLPPPDADLVAREPDLPGLAAVLDADAFAEILRAQAPDARIQGARATYLHYKPGTFCLVDYAVQADGHTVDAYGIAHRLDAAIKLRNAEEKGQVAGPFRVGRFVVEDLSLIVSFFPNDRRLRTLPALVDEKRRRRLFPKIFLEHPDMWEASAETLAPIHGDFQAEHVLLSEAEVRVVDLDEAARGNPAIDLGNFFAHLELDGIRGIVDAGRIEAYCEALLAGYDPTLKGQAVVATAAGLLRLAIDPFRDREPNWPGTMETILRRAESLIGRRQNVEATP